MTAPFRGILCGTTSMGGHRFHGPAPAQEVSAPMLSLSTKALTGALQAAFVRCELNGHPLSPEQQADVMAVVFEAFADEIIEGTRRR